MVLFEYISFTQLVTYSKTVFTNLLNIKKRSFNKTASVDNTYVHVKPVVIYLWSLK